MAVLLILDTVMELSSICGERQRDDDGDEGG